MSKIITPTKSRRLRWKIQQPGYYRDRAIQMAEEYGAWLAECLMAFARIDHSKYNECCKKSIRYHRRATWYAYKKAELIWKEEMDYQS